MKPFNIYITTRSIRCIKVSIESVQHVANHSTENGRFGSLNQNPDCPKTPKIPNFDSSRYFTSNYRFPFYHQALNRKLYVCQGAFYLKSMRFDPCVRIVIVSKFQKVLLLLVHLDIRTHASQLHFSFLRSSSLSETLQFYRKICLKKRLFSSLHQNAESPKIPRTAINTDLFRYSNSNFSVSTSLISSIKVSIESVRLVEEDSI